MSMVYLNFEYGILKPWLWYAKTKSIVYLNRDYGMLKLRV
jgi:hypothetical protein